MSKSKPSSVTPKIDSSNTPVLSPCSVPYRWILHVGRCVSVYFDKTQPNATWSNHRHSLVQILFFGDDAECTLHWEENNKWRCEEVKGRHLWVIGAHVAHKLEWRRETLRLVFYVEASFVRESIGSEINGSLVLTLDAIARCHPKIPQLLEGFEGLDQPASFAETIHVESLSSLATFHILRAWECLIDQQTDYRAGLSSSALSRIDQLVDRRMDSKLVLSEMAREVNMSVSNFVRLFKRSTGESPGQYLIRMRIQKSKTLLMNPGLRIGEIAYSVGFSNQGHFDLFFKRSVGMTPSEYRTANVKRGSIS